MATTKSSNENVDLVGFPISYTREQLQRDVAGVLLHHARVTGFMMSSEQGWAVLGKEPVALNATVLLDPEQEDAAVLSYDEVRGTEFARAMEAMYDYGYHGILDQSAESMLYGSIYRWVAAFLNDMRASATFYEWDSYGGQGSDVAARCYNVAELANARLTLEGHESFYHFRTGRPNEDSVAVEVKPTLTVRQMALLAGMEEMSIRAAANPKRATPLETYSDEEGRTRISVEAAKEWLQARKRYVPITVRYSRGDIDLAKIKFSRTSDLIDALDARHRFLSLRDGAAPGLDAQIQQLGIDVDRIDDLSALALSVEQLADGNVMRQLATVLELPADLLVLRAREAVAREELNNVERELRALEAK